MPVAATRDARPRFVLAVLIGATLLLLGIADQAGAFSGDKGRGYNRKMNGGQGCVAGDCSRSKEIRDYAKKHGAAS
jgi:hypothetical protein